MSTTTGRIEKRRNPRKPRNGRLPTLPKDAQVSKRPLLHPTIPSPYAGATQPKVVYVGSKTPFISVVKRAEKLLRLSDKRLVQSAMQIARDTNYRKRRRGGEQDEIMAIAEEVEAQKRAGKRRKSGVEDGEDAIAEEVVIKGSGKAISKVMELGVWFQERDEFDVRLQTGSAAAVDDVSYEEEVDANDNLGGDGEMHEVGEEPEATGKSEPGGSKHKPLSKVVRRQEAEVADGKKEVSMTRIRQVSVLEVYVSLR